MNELPTMASSAHTHSTYAGNDLRALGGQNFQNAFAGQAFAQGAANAFVHAQQHVDLHKGETQVAKHTRRIVQVFIADTDENVPLDKSMLFSGEQKLTDLTDQELFFEVDIKTLLDKHNAERVKLVDKSVKERTEHLEPARIRDLKMTVVVIAAF